MRGFLAFLFVLILTAASSEAALLDDVLSPFVRVDTTGHRETYPILTPQKDGSLRVLFAGDRGTLGRLSIETAARLDCRCETVLSGSRTSLGVTQETSATIPSLLSEDTMKSLLNEQFLKNWDVIVLDFDINALPGDIRDRVLYHASNGTGLVYFGTEQEIKRFLTGKKVATAHLDVVKYSSCGTSFTGTIGRGTVVGVTNAGAQSTVLEVGDFYNFAANAIFVAASPRYRKYIQEIEVSKKPIEHEAIGIMKYRVHLFNEEKEDSLEVRARFRDEKGTVVHESSATFIVDHKKSFVILDYPNLPNGSYSLDISLVDDGMVTAFAGASFTVTSTDHIAGIELWNGAVSQDDFITGTIQASFIFKEGIMLTAEMEDVWGRCLDRYEIETVPGRKSAEFIFRIKNPFSDVMIIRIKLYKNNEHVHTFEETVLIKRHSDPDTFSLVVMDDAAPERSRREKHQALVSAGVSAFTLDFSRFSDPGSAYREAVRTSLAGSSLISIPVRILGDGDIAGTGSSETVAEYENRLMRQLTAMLDTLQHTSTLAYLIPGGRPGVREGTVREAITRDPSPFHAFLTDTYGSVGELNSAWDTDFSAITEARMRSLEEAASTGSFAPWHDSKRYESEVLSRLYTLSRTTIAGRDSTVKVGMIPPRSLTDDGALWASGLLDMIVAPYPTDSRKPFATADAALIMSPAPPDALTGLLIPGGSNLAGSENFLRAAPWQCLFAGLNSIWWDTMSGSIGSAVCPDHSINPAFSIVAGGTSEIRKGIDRLLLGSTRQSHGIVILWSDTSLLASQTSVSGGTLEQLLAASPLTPAEKSAKSFYLACLDLWYTPTFATEEEVRNHVLGTRGCSLLILPLAQALHEETIAQIRAFVLAGGTVIADRRPAVMDENLTMREAGGALDDLFRIREGTNRISPVNSGTLTITPAGAEHGISTDATAAALEADPSVTASEDAEVLAAIDDMPAVIRNAEGDGYSVFLNMSWEQYGDLRDREAGEALRTVLAWCIESAEPGPLPVRVTDADDHNVFTIHPSMFTDGNGVYIGLVRDDLCRNDTDVFTLEINRSGERRFIYDVRERKFLGAVITLPLNLPPGGAKLFALMPYRVRTIDLSIQKTIVKIGELTTFTVAIVPQEDVPPGRHVIYVTVRGPDGEERHSLSRSYAAENGRLEASIPIVLNDPPGRWVVEARDVATGKRAERAFMVMQSDRSLMK